MSRVPAIVWSLLVWGSASLLAVGAVAWTVGMCWGGLVSVMTWLLGQLVLPALGGLALLGLGLAFLFSPRHRRVVAVLALVALGECAPGLQAVGVWTPAYPSTIPGSTPHATVRLPLDGPVVVGWGGDRVGVNYHATTPDQRWAYDLVVEPAAHGSGNLEDYGCYGLPVVAPADAEVVVKQTGHPDQDPSRYEPKLTAPAGNYLGLRLDTGTHLVLAHLQPGSIEVGVGDKVREGQVLARCGNSGNTSEPHVHIHHQRQKPDLIGIAEGLPLFFRGHEGPAMPEGGLEVVDGKIVLKGAVVRHRE